jgi:hypothetical protein
LYICRDSEEGDEEDEDEEDETLEDSSGEKTIRQGKTTGWTKGIVAYMPSGL